MNKGIFTLMTAALLVSGSVVTPAFADAEFAAYQSVNSEKVLANGVKFYLQKSDASEYYTVKEVTLKDKTKVWTLDETTEAKAAVFEVSNYAKVGNQYTFSLSANGKVVTLSATGAISDGQDLKADARTTTILTAQNKLGSINSLPAFLNGATGVGVTLVTSVEQMNAEALNNYNTKGFTFGFNAPTELVSNPFAQPIYAVDYTEAADLAAEAETFGNTYFVVGGTEKALKTLKDNVKSGNMSEGDLFNKDIKILALKKDVKYDVKAAKTTAFKLEAVAGDKANTGDYSAAFMVTEFDKLANPDEYRLKIESPVTAGTALYMGAIRFTSTDTKTYVTTVEKSEIGSLISATLGASTYLKPSVLLKEGAANYVNVYFTSSDESLADKTLTTEYHKYLVPGVEEGDFVYNAMAANDVNFKSAASQWAVKDFDGKYTFTLVNRETAQNLKLSLQESKVKGEYEVVAVGDDLEFGNLTKDGKAATSTSTAKTIAGTKVKFLPVEKAAGFLDLSKEEMEAGISLLFKGKTALIGEKTFYAAEKTVNGKTENLTPSMKASDLAALSIEKAKGKIDASDENAKAVENYTIQVVDVAYLKDGKVVAAKDTLFVPTYIIFDVEGEGDAAKTYCLNESMKYVERIEGGAAPAEFYFRQNADGSYAMGYSAEGDIRFGEEGAINASSKAINVTTNVEFAKDASVYAMDNSKFANVTVQVNDNSDKTTLPAKPRHASFDNMLGSINYQLNQNGITEGILSAESMIFWLDTADSKATTPFFYISKGIEVAEGEEAPAERMFMYNATDSMSVFNEGSAVASFNKKYMLEGTTEEQNIAKVIFRPATIAGVDTINTVVDGKAAVVVAKEDKAEEVLGGLDNFKFGICLADPAVEGEYVIYSKADNKKYVYALNGKLGLGSKDQAMVFTLGTEVPTSNESIDNAASSIVVIGNAGSVTIQGAQGETAYVRNLLGMPLAETVVTSDNATIAVPAGIVLVTVGEETVKVVVK
ncbi:DUF6383 domain-containing protein [Parabacteroides sp.]